MCGLRITGLRVPWIRPARKAMSSSLPNDPGGLIVQNYGDIRRTRVRSLAVVNLYIAPQRVATLPHHWQRRRQYHQQQQFQLEFHVRILHQSADIARVLRKQKWGSQISGAPQTHRRVKVLRLKLPTQPELHYTSGTLNRRDAAQVWRTNVYCRWSKYVVVKQIVRLPAELYALTFPRKCEVFQQS